MASTRSDTGSCQPAPSPWPLARSSKQASMMSSGSPCGPKSSPTAGPAQVTAPVSASTAHWSAVKSLNPTQRVPLRTDFAMALYGSRGSSRVRPYPPRVISAMSAPLAAARPIAARRVSSSPAKRMWVVNRSGSSSTSWPAAFSRAMPRRTAALSRTALDGE